jgi:Protein of unknown function (DUF1552)
MNDSRSFAERHLTRVGRRWFLTAAGVAVALPYLEALDLKEARAASGAKRLLLFHMPAGINVKTWVPTGTGTTFQYGAAMTPIDDAKLRAKMTVVTGTNGIGGPRGHTCGISGVLTGVMCQANSTQNAISFDQVAAASLGAQTRFPSLELGTTHNTENPNAETGYSTVIKDNLNWSSASTPLSREIEPLNAFNRLFTGLTTTPTTGTTPTALNVKDAMRKSVLDYALSEGSGLSARLGTADKAKLDQYLSGVRDLEKTIQTTPTVGQTGMCTPGAAPEAGKPADIQKHVKLMLDIIVTAFKCDLTRVATFAYEHTTTEIRHPFLNVNVGYHTSVTHHNNDPTALANYTTVNQWLVSQFVYALSQLDQVSDGAGTMLDSSVGMCFSELSDGNSHSNQNMPVLLGGSAGGKLQTGKVIAGSGAIEQVHVSLLQALDLNTQTFGRAKGPMPGLLV